MQTRAAVHLAVKFTIFVKTFGLKYPTLSLLTTADKSLMTHYWLSFFWRINEKLTAKIPGIRLWCKVTKRTQ